MTKRRLAIDDFKKLYNRYRFKIEKKYLSLDVDKCEKIYINLKEHNKNFKKMLVDCQEGTLNEYQILGVVLFHCYCLSDENIYTSLK